MRRRSAECVRQAGVLRDQISHTRPRRQRVERVDDAGSEHDPRAIAPSSRPAKRVKLRDQRGHFG